MRRLVVALIALAVASLLVGCGGGDAEETTQVSTDDTAVTEDSVASDSSGTANTAAPENLVGVTLPVDEALVPDAVIQRLESGQSMLVFFHQNETIATSTPEDEDTQNVTDDLRLEIEAVMDKYRGLIDFVEFDIDPEIVGSEIEDDSSAAKMYMFTDFLGIRQTPYVLVIDDTGMVTYSMRGYVERGVLEREIEYVIQ